MRIFHADLVYSGSRDQLISRRSCYIAVENGTVEGIYGELPEKYSGVPLTDYGSKYHAGMQTHLVESHWESSEAVRPNPACSCQRSMKKPACWRTDR